ncbi:enoyl-CoA hydratase [Methylobrevis pamukkalensis]|uniref:Enoyl-CoA hydratase domain-containing protein 3, mitochondrial n=1 Tax=Methylobrevis pamukkalensis TaxID=1439726 RepID=A0A1E3GY81_9HYPH|nr:enoyl-CoA hydratase [Methylobrevis pamukkalensis]ODN68984.1 Carnitinyl-CoA dehydratase [Methylobrevis pamukkalensis]
MNVETTRLVEETDTGAVRRIVLCDVKRRNALSRAMIDTLSDALTRAVADPAIRVVVLAGDGPAFSAGHDLREITAMRDAPDGGHAAFEDLMGACSALMTTVATLQKPVIAEVRGIATAAGCQLVASCDLALAGDQARFCTPGVDIGLFCSTPSVALTRTVAPKHAMEMLLTGRPIDAPRAAEIGLVNRVVADDALTDATMALAALIASKSGAAIATGKALVHAQSGLPLGEAYALAGAVMARNLLEPDALEGIGAFLEKRRPVWRR